MQRIIQTVSAEAAAHLQIRRSIVAALGVSLLTNAALALTLLTKTDNSRTVVLSPAATQTFIATNDAVSPNLLESFAAQSASILLNMTPATAAANAEIFLKNVAPQAYAAMAANVRRGASELVRNYASSVFYPPCLCRGRDGQKCMSERRTAHDDCECCDRNQRYNSLYATCCNGGTSADFSTHHPQNGKHGSGC